MTPTPATMSEIEAMPPRSRVRVVLIDDVAARACDSSNTSKWRCWWRQVVAWVTKQRRDGGARPRASGRRIATDRRWSVTPSPPDDAAGRDHRRRAPGPGRPAIWARSPLLGWRMPDDPHGRSPTADLRADSLGAEPEVAFLPRVGRPGPQRPQRPSPRRGSGQERPLPDVVARTSGRPRRADDCGGRARPPDRHDPAGGDPALRRRRGQRWRSGPPSIGSCRPCWSGLVHRRADGQEVGAPRPASRW